MLRAFDSIDPARVRCIILGQDPYPAPEFSTGRAFEAGNVAEWRELDKMFSKSVRAFIQLVCAAHTKNSDYARSFADWPATLDDIERGTIDLEPASELANRWASQHVLLLNSSLTMSRFQVTIDAHQSHGHLPIWRPLIVRALKTLIDRNTPLVIIAFGEVAAGILSGAGVDSSANNVVTILRKHPAEADHVLAAENPFLACNRQLEAMGAEPISW
jgi:uracil-DNA glycosylase